MMLREANHRIANSLQAVIAAAHVGAGRKDGASAAVRDQAMRVSAIADVHLLLSVSSDARTIPFDDYLVQLTGRLADLWAGESGRIKVTPFCATGLMSAEAAIQLGMAVNELVANACKYAYGAGEPGEIRVGFSIVEGKFTLLVADDGCGLPDADLQRSGIGRRLVTEIAVRMGGAFSYQSSRSGTVAVLTGSAESLLGSDLGGRMQATIAGDPSLDRRDTLATL